MPVAGVLVVDFDESLPVHRYADGRVAAMAVAADAGQADSGSAAAAPIYYLLAGAENVANGTEMTLYQARRGRDRSAAGSHLDSFLGDHGSRLERGSGVRGRTRGFDRGRDGRARCSFDGRSCLYDRSCLYRRRVCVHRVRRSLGCNRYRRGSSRTGGPAHRAGRCCVRSLDKSCCSSLEGRCCRSDRGRLVRDPSVQTVLRGRPYRRVVSEVRRKAAVLGVAGFGRVRPDQLGCSVNLDRRWRELRKH